MDERWVYLVVGLFLLFGLWMYTVNTVKIRQTALHKERLRTRVKTLCRLGARQLAGEWRGLDQVQPRTYPEFFRFLQDLEKLRIGEEYIFVLDTEGRTWADGSQPPLQRPGPPAQPEQDDSSPHTKLLQTSRKGGGFVSYEWKHPKNGEIKPKLSYVMPIGKSPFLLGCGTYA